MLVCGLAIACSESTGDADGEPGTTGGDPGDTSGETSAGSTDTSASDSESDGTTSGDSDLPAPPTNLDETVAIYGAAWNELDEDRRRALLELAWADDGLYRDPTVVAQGRDALVDAIGTFHADFPGSELEIVGTIDTYDGHLRFAWTITGTAALPGEDIGQVGDDLRLTAITGFFGPLPSGTPIPDPVAALVDAWAEDDAMARAALLDAAVTDDFVLRQPGLEIADREALDEHLAAGAMTLAGTPDAYGPVMRFGVSTSDGDGLAMATVADDGRLSALTMFFD